MLALGELNPVLGREPESMGNYRVSIGYSRIATVVRGAPETCAGSECRLLPLWVTANRHFRTFSCWPTKPSVYLHN